jgi:2-polyprenyl-6-methoxyphenol hydroxylase-like FAD-dependent oxidoreductase
MYESSVLIAGAGPTGLALAIDLARREIPLRIIDAARDPFQGSRGKGIQPRTLEIFDDLGVIDPILAAGGLYPKFRMHVGALSLRAGSLGSHKPSMESVPYPNLWMVPQFRTEEILRERLRTLGVRVEFDTTLVTFVQDNDGVEAALSTGERVRADFLVGCDGGHSTVRKILGVGLEGDALDDEQLVGDVEIADLERSDWHLWPFAKGGMIGLCPLPGTSLFQFQSKARMDKSGMSKSGMSKSGMSTPGMSQAGTGSAETATVEIEEIIYRVTGHKIQRVAWSSIYRPSVRMVDRYRVGRVFLAGDAAHVHPPTGGQGLNTGVQDAYNLGWKLAHVIRRGPDSLLDTYEAERLPIAAAVLGLSQRIYQSRSIKRGEATNQLALHYRTSSLSSSPGESFGKLRPGDRMPDMRLRDGSRLFEHLRGCHATELITRKGPRILIRPDGYIAHIGAKRFGEYAGRATLAVEA